jgi:hypothetical protein
MEWMNLRNKGLPSTGRLNTIEAILILLRLQYYAERNKQ